MPEFFQLGMNFLSPESSEGEAKELLLQSKRDLKIIPNMYALMANAPEVLESYLHGYERFQRDSGFTPAEQTVVFLTISYENGCDYCVAGHSMAADFQSPVPREVTEAILNDQVIPDPKLRALAEFTRVLLYSRGRPTQEEGQAFLSAGYQKKQVLDLVLGYIGEDNLELLQPSVAYSDRFHLEGERIQTRSVCGPGISAIFQSKVSGGIMNIQKRNKITFTAPGRGR